MENKPHHISIPYNTFFIYKIYIINHTQSSLYNNYTINRYNFKVTAADGTETAEFTFFNDVGYKITGHRCIDVVSRFKPTPEKPLPSEVTNIIGQRHIFQIQFPSNSQKGAGRFIVNDILDLSNPTDPNTTGSSTTTEDVPQTPLPITTSATKNTPAPGTPETNMPVNITDTIATPHSQDEGPSATPFEQRPQTAKRSLNKAL